MESEFEPSLKGGQAEGLGATDHSGLAWALTEKPAFGGALSWARPLAPPIFQCRGCDSPSRRIR